MAELRARVALPRFVQLGRGGVLTLALQLGANPVLPTEASSSFSLLDADGATVVEAVAGNVSVGNDLVSYQLASTFGASYSLPQPRPWREVWNLDVDGVAHTIEREVYVVRAVPMLHLTDEDLYRLHSDWRRLKPPGRSSYDEPIAAAWEELLQRLLGDQVLPHQVLNWWAAARPLKYLAAAIVCRDFGTTEGRDGKWTNLAAVYQKMADDAYAELFLRRDEDDDGVAHNSEAVAAEPELFLTWVPPRRSW